MIRVFSTLTSGYTLCTVNYFTFNVSLVVIRL